VSIIGQPSLFGVAAQAPEPTDLAGLLVAGADGTRWDDLRSARVAVVVNHPWRASALVMECARRGVAATCATTAEHRIGVRTAYSPDLLGLVEAWSGGVPAGLVLDGQPLRLWVVAAGHYERSGIYRLASTLVDARAQQRIGAALAHAGLAAALVGVGGGGCWYRISGKKRLARLAELVGDPPKRAPIDFWPS
jgi:hypothetical protein